MTTEPTPDHALPATRGSVASRVRVNAVSVTEASHRPGRELPLHAHPRWSAILVTDGTFVEQHEGRSWDCRRGDVLIRPSQAAHSDRFGPEGATYAVVEFPDRVLAAVDNGASFPSRIQVFRGGAPGRLMREIRGTARPGSGRSLELAEILEELLVFALVGSGERRARPLRPTSPPPWLTEVYERVYAEFRDRPAVRELARDAGVHPDHVCRAFRRQYGFTINDLIRRRRVETAAAAIRGSDRPLSRVAYDAGFSDQSHMTRQVRRYLGVTPGELRPR